MSRDPRREQFKRLWPQVFTGPVSASEACLRLGVEAEDLRALVALGLLEEQDGTLRLPSSVQPELDSLKSAGLREGDLRRPRCRMS